VEASRIISVFFDLFSVQMSSDGSSNRLIRTNQHCIR